MVAGRLRGHDDAVPSRTSLAEELLVAEQSPYLAVCVVYSMLCDKEYSYPSGGKVRGVRLRDESCACDQDVRVGLQLLHRLYR